ncbi:MAG: nicotinamide-nucleotide amidohydrolase family protein, partial [Actinobacteria bacterium]|nr:nicotinamide-nucleotide amidohydrolase family protein [Actinomycetota bacterium]
MNYTDRVIELLRQRGETVSVAESLTGGSLSKALTDIEGASHIFLGGVIAYSAASKLHDLDVPQDVIDSAGVYSKETALAMADARLYEAAAALGASRRRTFFTVTLPGAKYGVISAAFVVFTLVITDFGIAKVIGGR